MSNYLPLSRPSDVDAAIDASHAAPIAILKHSTSCSISHLAKARVDRSLRGDELGLPVYLVDLLQHRDVSDYIAERLGVRHESPQILVVGAGELRYSASHLDIDPYALTVA